MSNSLVPCRWRLRHQLSAGRVVGRNARDRHRDGIAVANPSEAFRLTPADRWPTPSRMLSSYVASRSKKGRAHGRRAIFDEPWQTLAGKPCESGPGTLSSRRGPCPPVELVAAHGRLGTPLNARCRISRGRGPDRHVSLAVGGVSIVEGPMPTTTRSRRPSPSESWQFLDQACFAHLSISARPNGSRIPTSICPITSIVRRFRIQATMRPCSGLPPTSWSGVRSRSPAVGMLIIEGLADGRWALLMKIHHCIATESRPCTCSPG